MSRPSSARRCSEHGASRLRTCLWRFARGEDGSVTVLALFFLLIMMGIAGIGIDLMRYERNRASLQYTLDRAVLAAADLDQSADPETVVRDYLDQAGLLQYLTGITVEEGLGFRKVEASAESAFPTQFMHMSGVDTLNAPARSVAEESIGVVEISLILDVSGSMGRNNRLRNLKVAAKDFIDVMLDNTEEGSLSISIIPYATQVNAGASLLSKYPNVTKEHNYSHCVNFTANQFSKSDLDQYDILERTGHFDPWSWDRYGITTPVCPVRAGTEILPLTDDRNALHRHIDAMTADGNTSIDIGMKWGAVLLDPSARNVVSGLIGDGVIDAKFQNRPSNYDSDVLKIAIVMSDGQNTDQYMLNPSLRDTMSDVWYNSQADRFSTRHSQGNNTWYYWADYYDWEDHPYGDEEYGDAVRLSYAELFDKVSIRYFADHLYRYTNSGWGRQSSAYSKKNASAKDQQTKHVCDAAKDQGVIVYGVAFEAPWSGYRVLKDCASSDSHMYDVDGLEISDAFASIASSIRKLRLTQ